jgi:HAD superfamily hydrolase (TIGR01490 family)
VLKRRSVTSRRAALFDMDRTLIRVDSGTLYIRYQRQKGEATYRDVARVAWWMLQYTFGVIDAERVAMQVMESFKGRDTCEGLFSDSVVHHVQDAGRRAIERHRQSGDLVAIVTGATPYVALPLARELGIDHVIATRLEVVDGAFTGRIEPPMNYGAGKVARVEMLAEEHGFTPEDATFYSDSITDLPLLERVGTPVAVNPDARLRRVAQKRGWKIEEW